jgi:RNAse (barnase) inhibitor barstar
MENLFLSDIFDLELSKDDIVNFLERNKDGFYLKINYSYIGSCQSHVDVMQDHLEVSYIIENILGFSELINFERNYSTYPYSIILCLRPLDNQQLSKVLQKMSILKAENKDPDEEDMCEIMDEIDDFENNIENIRFKFFEEIDDYYANYITSGIYEIASEFSDDEEGYLEDKFSKHPEWQYGFWQMHIPEIKKNGLYGSIYCWIISPDIDIITTLSNYSGIDRSIMFEEASELFHSELNVIINDFVAIDKNSFLNFYNAISCIDYLSSKSSLTDNSDLHYYISKNSDIVSITYKKYNVIYFKFRILRNEEIKTLYANISQLNSHLNNLMGFGRNLECNWDLLDNEKFEELCYEIIYNHFRFNSSTIRKMGKSKSRDGGRDIVVYTNHRIGLQKKFIIQCKLLKKGKSLTKRKLYDVANVIMEYEADGYIVMTNAIIDTTLHDMLDGFAKNKNMNIDTETRYSKYELERHLSVHTGIRERYFGQ